MVRRADASPSDSIEVTLARMGEAVQSYLMPADSTVGQVLDQAGISRSSAVKVNGEVVGLEDLVDDGDRLVIAQKTEAGRA